MYAVEFNTYESMIELLSVLGIADYTEDDDNNVTVSCELSEQQVNVLINDRRVVYVSEL